MVDTGSTESGQGSETNAPEQETVHLSWSSL